MKQRPYLKLGTIGGRHQMPVKRHLMKSTEIMGTFPQLTYAKMYEIASKFPFDKSTYAGIELYYSGYTPATIAAVDAFEARGIEVRLMAFNHITRKYSHWVRNGAKA